MDPVANQKEQRRIAADILKVWDDCCGDGTLTKDQSEYVADQALRLAELVEALAQWNRMHN